MHSLSIECGKSIQDNTDLVNETSIKLPVHFPSSRTACRVGILNETLDGLSSHNYVDSLDDNVRILMIIGIMSSAAVLMWIVSFGMVTTRIISVFVKNKETFFARLLKFCNTAFSLTVAEHVLFYLSHNVDNDILGRMVNRCNHYSSVVVLMCV